MKSTVLLATALFLASAPTPDSDTISEMSGGFLSGSQSDPLRAAEPDLMSSTTQASAADRRSHQSLNERQDEALESNTDEKTQQELAKQQRDQFDS